MIIATATLTVAVDPKEWHCDAIFVFAGSGMGCSPRDQGQAAGRFGRQGPGSGPGQISEYDGVNGVGVYMLVHFGVKPESFEYRPSISRDELFASKRVGILFTAQRKRRHMHSTFDATVLSTVRSAPGWYTNVLAWDETEQTSHQNYVMYEWEAMCERRGWQFTVRTGYEIIGFNTEFDHGVARPVPSELHEYVNSQTITLPATSKDDGEETTKYTRAIDILDVYAVVTSIVGKVAGDEVTALETIDVLETIRCEDRPNSMLTQIANDLFLFPRVLSGKEYSFLMKNQRAFHEQRNLRTKSTDELLLMDESKACIAEAVNLRHGRAQAFLGTCRDLNVAWHELFVGEFQVPDATVFEPKYKFDDTHASFARDLVQHLRNWAAFTATSIKATEYKSELLVGFEKICRSYGLRVQVSKSRKRQDKNTNTRESTISGIVVHADVGEGKVSTTSLVESSSVKQGGLWVAFRAFEPEEFVMPMHYAGDVVTTDRVYEELVDTAALVKMIGLSEVEVGRLERTPDTAQKLLTERKSQLTNLKNMVSEIVDGKIQTTYHRCFMNTGRRYANGPSLQKCSGIARSTSARYYYDVDMRNAHPAIVAYIVGGRGDHDDNSQAFPSLIRYGTAEKNEREAILREVTQVWQCTRKAAKQLFVSVINAGTVEGWQGTNKLAVEPVLWPTFVHTYSAEAGRLIHLMAAEKPEIVKLSRECIQTKERRDIELYHKSRALNVTMQEYEDQILSIMETHAESADWQFDVLIYDGALLRRREDRTEDDVKALMRSMEHEIYEKTGIPIGLELKEL